MESGIHSMSNLFAQLGLPADSTGIDRFVDSHRPLAEGLALADAPFWTPAQAAFLRDEIIEDGDWAEVVDQLNLALRGDYPGARQAVGAPRAYPTDGC